MDERLPCRLTWAIELLALRPADQVLEVGCGHGLALPLVLERLPEGRLTAIDRSASAIGAAQRRCPVGVELRCVDLDEAQFAPGAFDAIYAVNVALHRSRSALDALSRWLRPGGRLLLVQQPPASARTPVLARELQAALDGGWALEPLRYREIEGVQAVAALARSGEGL